MGTLEHMSSWRYAKSVEKERSQALLAAPSFSDLSDQVAKKMKILCGHCDPCQINADFHRVVFCIKISPELFDLFFNSPNGYRGAYFESPYRGLEANAEFIGRLEADLLDWAGKRDLNIDTDFATESLRTPSAKVWLAECGNQLCGECKGEFNSPQDDHPEICNGLWEGASGPNGGWGRKAPKLTRLRIFGAFLNERHDEFIDERKRHRAKEIHECGWS